MVVLPSDHLIGRMKRIQKYNESAREILNNNNEAIVTLGMTPTRAETGYGYIKYGNESEIVDKHKVIKVDAFVEKPNKEKAKEYLEKAITYGMVECLYGYR